MNFAKTKSLLKRARAAYEKAQILESELFYELHECGINLENPSLAENAENLGDAITCYLQYGEYGEKELMDEIRRSKKE